MGNIIKFQPKKVSDSSEYVMDESLIGVRDKYSGAEFSVDGDDIMLSLQGSNIFFQNRKEAAEFFHMCAVLVDSECRWKPDEMVGINYKD